MLCLATSYSSTPSGQCIGAKNGGNDKTPHLRNMQEGVRELGPPQCGDPRTHQTSRNRPLAPPLRPVPVRKAHQKNVFAPFGGLMLTQHPNRQRMLPRWDEQMERGLTKLARPQPLQTNMGAVFTSCSGPGPNTFMSPTLQTTHRQ